MSSSRSSTAVTLTLGTLAVITITGFFLWISGVST
jgi:hypothetical protein